MVSEVFEGGPGEAHVTGGYTSFKFVRPWEGICFFVRVVNLNPGVGPGGPRLENDGFLVFGCVLFDIIKTCSRPR
jgi:hypothetical protein